MYENPYLNRFKQKSKVSPNHFKQTTGLTGLFVVEYPHRNLKIIYDRILRTIEKIPMESVYRKSTEHIVKSRLALVNEVSDIQELEKKIGMGQIEEVIEQAEYELQTARAILESKAWEPLVEKPAEEQWRWPVV
uniref:NADH dehydrogenase [ubiquinone] 1 alpha subcomplex subunit 5 n=1 Tax=Strongyloides ratti TaxID=34506 RepID=A0A090L3U1_STRRB|nr:NADH dehydrogenase [ubiquinone] 1 alpha subcomplex subunit 5 [Strongyloides ratti]CEF64392.1 NADH dehydrogenase [ubiquinone] 1 alpha subcomplex subunit 5 [Strongyloides ratti]